LENLEGLEGTQKRGYLTEEKRIQEGKKDTWGGWRLGREKESERGEM
jgi:hypothetical protein